MLNYKSFAQVNTGHMWSLYNSDMRISTAGKNGEG